MKRNVGFCLFVRVFQLDWISCKMLDISCFDVLYLRYDNSKTTVI